MRWVYMSMYMMVVAGCTESGQVPGEDTETVAPGDADDTIQVDVDEPDDTSDTSPDVPEVDTLGDTLELDALDDTAETDVDAIEVEVDAIPSGCESFAITPEKTFLEPFGFAVFTAVGASEARRFELIDDLTGASVHPTLGTFLAGPQSGDVQVRLRDPVCGERRAVVVVVEALELLPRLATIEPVTGHLQLEVVGVLHRHEHGRFLGIGLGAEALGVVDQDVDGAERAHRLRDHVEYLILVADVAGNADGGAAGRGDLFDDAVERRACP